MKRSFLARRNTLLTPSSISLGTFAIGIVLLIVLARLLFPSIVLGIAAPIFRVGAYFADRSALVFDGFQNAATLMEERDALAKSNAALSVKNQALLAELADLKKLTGGVPNSLPGVVAGVLVRPPEAGYDVLIIGVGTDTPITSGMRAYADDTPIGTVTSVASGAARITLFSAPGVATEGWLGAARTPLTLAGAGGGAFNASVAKSANPAVGDVVYVPGPGALPVGSVSRIDADASSPSATLRITPLVNPFSITWVEVRP